jgi:hypothetical protein
MDLFHKVRVLAGALVHKPFSSRPRESDSEQSAEQPDAKAARRDVSELEKPRPRVEDSDRVADLIARRKDGESG